MTRRAAAVPTTELCRTAAGGMWLPDGATSRGHGEWLGTAGSPVSQLTSSVPVTRRTGRDHENGEGLTRPTRHLWW